MRHAVIMAGGSGTRLWPLSRARRPKQLIDVVADADGGAHSLLAEAFPRMAAVVPAEHIWVCTAAHYGDQVRAALPGLGPDRLVLEPVARDTANAVGLAAALVADADPDAELAVVSADHVIRPVERFAAAVRDRVRRARRPAGRPGHPRRPADLAGHRLRLRAARRRHRGARRGRGGLLPREARPRRPPSATWRRGSTSGTPACSSGGPARSSTRSPTTCRRPREGLARIVAARAGAGAGRRPRRGLPDPAEDQRRLRRARACRPEPGRVLVADLDVEWLDVGSWPALAATLATATAATPSTGWRWRSTPRATSSSAPTRTTWWR